LGRIVRTRFQNKEWVPGGVHEWGDRGKRKLRPSKSQKIKKKTDRQRRRNDSVTSGVSPFGCGLTSREREEKSGKRRRCLKVRYKNSVQVLKIGSGTSNPKGRFVAATKAP